MAELERELTMAVDCPWCIAKAGEPCYIQVPYDMKRRSGNGVERPTDRFHLARTAGSATPDGDNDE
jgi:hypothetical protein